MIIMATVVVTIASHRRQSTSRKSVKRQLSFTKLPAVDQNEASSGDDAQDWAHELHVRQADLQNQCP